MLYNPQWKSEGNDPLSLTSLISWLESKDPNATYNYLSCSNCLLAQYFKEMGYKAVEMGNTRFLHSVDMFTCKRVPLPEGWNEIAMGPKQDSRDVMCYMRLTFGDALKRAYELRAKVSDKVAA